MRERCDTELLVAPILWVSHLRPVSLEPVKGRGSVPSNRRGRVPMIAPPAPLASIPVLEHAAVGAPQLLRRVAVPRLPVPAAGTTGRHRRPRRAADRRSPRRVGPHPDRDQRHRRPVPARRGLDRRRRAPAADPERERPGRRPVSASTSPVSCVEAGRWGGARTFSDSSARQPPGAPSQIRGAVAENLRRTGHKRSDQGVVWDTVGDELNRLDVDSATSNFAAADDVLDAPPRPGRDDHARLEVAAAADLVGAWSAARPVRCRRRPRHRGSLPRCSPPPELLAGQWTAGA